MRAMDYAIALAGVVGVVIAVERAVVLFQRTNRAALFTVLERTDRETALRYVTDQPQTPLMRLAKAALISRRGEVQAALDEALLRETPRLESRTQHVAMLAQTVTLTGMLASVSNVMDLLRAVPWGGRGPTALLGATMSSTALGLAVGLVLLMSYWLLISRTQTVVAELHETSAKLRRYLR